MTSTGVIVAVLAKATLLVLVVMPAARVARRHSASFRHLLYLLGCVALLAMPAAATLMPAVPIHLPVLDASQSQAGEGVTGEARFTVPETGIPAGESARRTDSILPNLLGALWVLGASACLLRMCLGVLRLRQSESSQTPAPVAQAHVNRLAREFGLRRHVSVVSDAVAIAPIAYGVVRPRVVLPRGFETWTTVALQSALRHEIEHIRRFDAVWQFLAQAVCALYWFHPLVWRLCRCLRIEAERACDDAVLVTADPTEYADLLMRVAMQQRKGPGRRAALAMANRADIAVRISAILDPGESRRAARPTTMMLACVVAGCVALLVGEATLRLEARPAEPKSVTPQASGSTASTRTRAFDAVSIKEAEPDSATVGGMRLLPNGDIDVRRLRAARIIGIAHQIDMYRLVSEPAWTNEVSYDIVARANAPATRDDTFAMMRTMLAERFNLQVHRETRPLQGFRLVRGSGFGPGLKPSTVDCEADARDPRCLDGEIALNHIRAVGMPVATLVTLVAGVMRTPIIDRTGLTGTFDVDLRWSPESAPDPDAPHITSAIQEQLGLRLQRERVPTEVLVVDHIERPSSN